jgi:Antibiotic biosynthesis monooxygenase
MYAVIFEVEPKPGKAREYLDIAATLRPALDKIAGFISIERFESVYLRVSLFPCRFGVTKTRFAPGAPMSATRVRNREAGASSARIPVYAYRRFCGTMAWSTDRKHLSEPDRPGASLSNAESIAPNAQVSRRSDGNRHSGVTFHRPHLLYLLRA